MKIYDFSHDALFDMAEISHYSAAQWGDDRADSYINDINAACADLANGIKQGRPVEGREGEFKYRVGSHFVFFCPANNGILVIRVLHVNMDPVRHLS